MNIAINALDFRPKQMGGVETYLRNLWSHLQTVTTDEKFAMLCNESNDTEFIATTNFSIKACNYKKGSLKRSLRKVIKGLSGYDILRAEPKYLNYDLIHHPFTYITPKWHNYPSILSFMDMQHEFYPEFFSAGELEHRKIYKTSAQVASRIIAISEYTKKCLVERYGIPEQKIDVVYLGYGSGYRVIPQTDSDLETIKKKYGLEKPFMFYPAATWPHKNHSKLLRALRIIIDRYNFDGELILTGIPMNAHDEIMKEIDALKLTKHVRLLGYLDVKELPYLYNIARFLVFPSLFEGFGIPVVEAMACGCPVACSNVTSLPEVVENAGVVFDPTSIEDMAEKIYGLWCDSSKLDDFSKAGLERVQLFQWEAMATKTIEVYRRAIQ